jgi:hypothetical protein
VVASVAGKAVCSSNGLVLQRSRTIGFSGRWGHHGPSGSAVSWAPTPLSHLVRRLWFLGFSIPRHRVSRTRLTLMGVRIVVADKEPTDARRAVARVGPTGGQRRRPRRNFPILRHAIDSANSAEKALIRA